MANDVSKLPAWAKKIPAVLLAAERFPDIYDMCFEKGAYQRRGKIQRIAVERVGIVKPV